MEAYGDHVGERAVAFCWCRDGSLWEHVGERGAVAFCWCRDGSLWEHAGERAV